MSILEALEGLKGMAVYGKPISDLSYGIRLFFSHCYLPPSMGECTLLQPEPECQTSGT